MDSSEVMNTASSAVNATGSRPDSNYSGDLKRLEHGEVWTPEVIQRVVTIVALMVLTLIGNVAVIAKLGVRRRGRRSTTTAAANPPSRVNVFIINLAVGDLTVCCFTMTTEVLFVVFEKAWLLGAVACRLLLYIQIVTLASTTFLLAVMSFDRYLAICRPMSSLPAASQARRWRMIVVSWIMAFIFATPQLIIFKQVPVGVYPDGEIKYKCASRGYTAWWQRKLYFSVMTAYILVIPAVFMTFCYINVVLVVWRRSRELSASKPPSPSTHPHQQQTGSTGNAAQVTGSSSSCNVRLHSDTGCRRFCRLRSDAARNERTAASLNLRLPETDKFSTETGNRSPKPSATGSRSFRWFCRGSTGSERSGVLSTSLRSPEVDEFSTGTGNRSSKPSGAGSRSFRRFWRAASERSGDLSSPEVDEFSSGTGNRSPTTSPPLRRAAFNTASMSRARVRTVQMTLCIVCSFIACWTPYFTVHLIHIWSEYRRHIPETVYVFVETLALVNSAVNPLLYALFNASASRCRCRRRLSLRQSGPAAAAAGQSINLEMHVGRRSPISVSVA